MKIIISTFNQTISCISGIKIFLSRNVWKKWSFMVALLFFIFALISQQSSAQWTKLNKTAPDGNNGQLILLSDGRVLCHTNNEPSGDIYDILTPDANGSYVNGNWSKSSQSNQQRYSFPSVVLKNGNVYLAGGEYGTDGFQAGIHAEIYNPFTDSWTQTGPPSHVISDGNVQILENGKVLQAELYADLRQMEIYDPVTNAYSAAPNSRGVHNESMWVSFPTTVFYLLMLLVVVTHIIGIPLSKLLNGTFQQLIRGLPMLIYLYSYGIL